MYLYITCNKKILFVKKYFSLLWVFTYFSILLFCFLNVNTVITWQLIRTARTLDSEWWQVCREAWVWGQRKMSQVLGAFGLLDFTMLRPVLAWRVFLNLWTVYFFNFSNFFFGPRPTTDNWNHGYGSPPVRTKLWCVNVTKVSLGAWDCCITLGFGSSALWHCVVGEAHDGWKDCGAFLL